MKNKSKTAKNNFLNNIIKTLENAGIETKKLNKKEKILAILLILITLFFGGHSFKRLYFNEIYYKVPNLVGLNYEKAEKDLGRKLKLKNMGEVFSKLPYGTIAIQHPNPDSIVKKHRNIRVWVSKAPQAVFIQNLVGMNILEARSIAEQQGLKIGSIVKINGDLGINRVIATSLPTGEPLNKGDSISFLINN